MKFCAKLDSESRLEMGDESTELMGIARHVAVQPLEIVLHSRSSLFLAGHLSDHGRLVMALDATGGLMNIRNTKADGKIQHTFLNVQCSECVLDNDVAKEFSKGLYSPIVISERISSSHTASDISKWLSGVKNDIKLAMSSIQGKNTSGNPVRPVAIKMDCAPQLMQGAIDAFRLADCDQVKHATTYNNCVYFVMLRYEGKLRIDDTDKHVLAKWAYDTLMSVAPCIMKQCKAHVNRAIAQYPTRKSLGLCEHSAPKHKAVCSAGSEATPMNRLAVSTILTPPTATNTINSFYRHSPDMSALENTIKVVSDSRSPSSSAHIIRITDSVPKTADHY